MERLKPFNEAFEPDHRNLMFVDLQTGQPGTFEQHHTEINDLVVDSAVPEDVRSYFATVQNVCLYGWFSYDLYAVVQFLCGPMVEMALRKRLPVRGKDRRGLSDLMKEAVKAKLINEKSFSYIRQMRRNLAGRLWRQRQIPAFRLARSQRTDYGEILAKAIPALRNNFAHPEMHTICMPWQAIFELRFSAELINQLFVGKKAKAQTSGVS